MSHMKHSRIKLTSMLGHILLSFHLDGDYFDNFGMVMYATKYRPNGNRDHVGTSPSDAPHFR